MVKGRNPAAPAPANGPDHLDAVFAALAHPIRRAIVERLSLGDCPVGDLAAGRGVSLPASATFEQQVQIENRKPNPIFSWSPSDPTSLEDIQFIDSSTDADGTITAWLWNFPAGEQSTDRHPVYRFNTPGAYPINLTVFDNLGESSSAVVLVSVSNIPPQAAFQFQPTSPVTHQTVQFVDHSLDADGAIVDRLWDFGDESFSSVDFPEHVFAEAGSYPVCLNVTDNSGESARTCQSIRVLPQEYAGRATGARIAIGAVSTTAADTGEIKANESASAEQELASVPIPIGSISLLRSSVVIAESTVWSNVTADRIAVRIPSGPALDFKSISVSAVAKCHAADSSMRLGEILVDGHLIAQDSGVPENESVPLGDLRLIFNESKWSTDGSLVVYGIQIYWQDDLIYAGHVVEVRATNCA